MATTRAGSCTGPLQIPDGLSLLLHLTPNGYVTGLQSAPPSDRPPLVTLIHLSFDTMVGIGFGLLLLGAWLALAWWRTRVIPPSIWFLRATAERRGGGGGDGSGWIVTEADRQPWIVYGVLRVADAVNPALGLSCALLAPSLLWLFLLFQRGKPVSPPSSSSTAER